METLIKFKQFVDEIMSSNSRNYKKDILTKYKEDQDIWYYLNYVYNPYIITGISDKKLNKTFLELGCPNNEILKFAGRRMIGAILEYIKANNTGTDAVLRFYHANADTLPTDLHQLLDKIVTKNLQLGIDVKTINSIIPGAIPEFNVQLANKYFDDPTKVDNKMFALTTKIDGGRIIAIKKNGVARFFTRQGQEYEGLVDLKKEMEEDMPDNTCLDGEITLLDPWIIDSITEDIDLWGEDHMIGRKLTSKEQYKKTMMITRKDGEKHGVKMLVFDYMTADEFENQKCNTPYYERRANLNTMFTSAKKHTYFELLPVLYTGKDTSEIIKWLDYNIQNEEEGVMINIWDAPYDFKRTNNLLKVKKMQTLDLQIIGYEEGSNSNKGKLGAFIVRYKDGNEVKVGSGYSKELREEIWKNPDSYIGKIIEVQYFEETKNANGGISLRFPVFNDFRTDKNEPDF